MFGSSLVRGFLGRSTVCKVLVRFSCSISVRVTFRSQVPEGGSYFRVPTRISAIIECG